MEKVHGREREDKNSGRRMRNSKRNRIMKGKGEEGTKGEGKGGESSGRKGKRVRGSGRQ